MTYAWTSRPPVIAVLRAAHAQAYAPVIDALLHGGIEVIELTLTTPDTVARLPELVAQFGTHAALGVGTVTDADQVESAVAAGAGYLVTPTTDPAVIAAAARTGTPIHSGGFTPTELFRGWRLSGTAVKLFPASLVSPAYLADLRGPFPSLPVIPSGGVSLDAAPSWLRAGAVAVSVGGPLIGDAFNGGDLAALRRRSHELCAAVSDSRSPA